MSLLDLSILVLTPRQRRLIADGLHLLACDMDEAAEPDDALIEVVRLKSHVELDGRVAA